LTSEHPELVFEFSDPLEIISDDTFWDQLENRRLYFQWISKKLSLHSEESWYDVTIEILSKYGGKLALKRYDHFLGYALDEVSHPSSISYLDIDKISSNIVVDLLGLSRN
jgi:hypothetical protein